MIAVLARMSIEKKEYIKKRRKSLLVAVGGLAAFGAVLFALSFFNRKMNVGVVSSGGLYNISGKLKDSMNAEPEQSQNILKKPVKARFSLNETSGELLLKKSIRVGNKDVENAVFYLRDHGEMLYSYNFVSDNENIYCRGVMKKGEEFFFVYFCSDKRD